MSIFLARSARLILTIAICLAFALPTAMAQDGYPSEPVRIIIPGSAGGINDVVARLISPGLSQRLGRPVVVENRPGASTTLGGDIVAKAKPDGHTLLMGVSTLAINPATYLKMPYDALRDFAPITHAVTLPLLLVVHPSVRVNSVKELIALAKARPDEILYGSAGHGTNPHLAMELFASMASIRLRHVPYKGTAAVIDLLGGHIAAVATSMSTLIPHVRAGKLRALGVTSVARVPIAPDIPTIAEAGLPGYDASQWSGLVAPAKTPQEIISRLHKESVALLRSPNISATLANDGTQVIASSPDEFAAFIKSETVKWAKVAKAAGIQPE